MLAGAHRRQLHALAVDHAEFLRHHAVGAGRQRRAGEDPRRLAQRQAHAAGVAGGDPRADRQAAAAARQVGGAQGVAVHRAVVPMRQVHRRQQVLAEHSSHAPAPGPGSRRLAGAARAPAVRPAPRRAGAVGRHRRRKRSRAAPAAGHRRHGWRGLQVRDEIARAGAAVQLRQENLVPGGATGARRAGQAAHQGTVAEPGQRPRLDGGSADLALRDLAEQFAEALDIALEQRPDRLRVLSRAVKPVPPVIRPTCTSGSAIQAETTARIW